MINPNHCNGSKTDGSLESLGNFNFVLSGAWLWSHLKNSRVIRICGKDTVINLKRMTSVYFISLLFQDLNSSSVVHSMAPCNGI